MPLTGDLDVVDLGQVFQMLSSTQKEGRLILQKTGESKELWFSPRGIALEVDEDELRDKVLDVLHKLSRISEENLHTALQQSQDGIVHPINVLLSLGFLDPNDVNEVYRRLVADKVYELFQWKQGRFEFIEEPAMGSGEPGRAPLQFLLRAESVVMEAARRLDERQEIERLIPEPGVVFFRSAGEENFMEASLDALETHCLRWVDGYASVKAVIERTGLSAFEVEKSLTQLYKKGLIDPLPEDRLSQAGAQAFERNLLPEAAHLFERAERAGVDVPECIGAAARARETMHDYQAAARHYRDYAAALVEQGEFAVAVEVLLHTAELLPTDLSSRELLVKLSLERSPEALQDFDAREQGLALVDQFVEVGDHFRAVALLNLLVEVYSQDKDLRLQLASALEETGERERAMAIFLHFAAQAEMEKDLAEALRLLQKALHIDPDRLDLRDRVSAINRKFEEKKLGRRGLYIGCGIAAAVMLLFGGVVYREVSARDEFKNLKTDALIAKGDFQGAEDLYREFVDNHGLTFVSSDAEKAIAQVSILKEEAAKKRKERFYAEEQNRARQLAAAEMALKEANIEAGQGHLVQALELMKKSLDQGPRDWERRSRVEREVSELEEYVNKADELVKEAKKAEESGDLLEARRKLRMVMDRFPHSPVASQVLLPFRVETTPPGALVSWEGSRLTGRTPLVHRIVPEGKGTLTIEREGFAQQKITLNADSNDELRLTLMRVPDRLIPVEGLPVTDPVISANRFYLGLAGGKLLSYDLESGAPLWDYKIEGFGEITTSPRVAGNLIFFGASDLGIYALNLAGDLRWKVQADKPVRTPPLMSGEHLYAVTESGRLLSLDAQTGKQEWKSSVNAAVVAPILSRKGSLVVGDLKGVVHLLDSKTGEESNGFPFGTAVFSLLPVEEDRFLVLGEDGRLALYSMEVSRPIWERKGEGFAKIHPVIRGDKVLLAEGKELVQVDLRTGQETERMDIPAPIVRGLRFGAGALYGRDAEGYWISIEINNHLIRWRAKIPTMEVAFEVDPRKVWILGRDRNLYLFDEAAAQFSSLIGR